MEHPKSDEYEISLFGPGFGEAVLVHLGSGKWIAVDSCVDAVTGKSVPLTYLNSLNVNVAKDVELVVATHWHNDHIAGISDLFLACEMAEFAMPRIFMRSEFLQLVLQNSAADPSILGKATTQMATILRLLKIRNKAPVFSGSDRLILGTQRGLGAQVFALSPHDRLFEAFLLEIGNLLGQAGQPQRRLQTITPNRISVAMLIKALGSNILLGADLEETPHGGWTQIIEDSQSLEKPINVIKIPHHGSENGHFDPLWSDFLVENAIAILTPFNRGQKKLPSLNDIDRIMSLTNRSFTTASPDAISSTKRAQTVEQQMSNLKIDIKLTNPRQGQVRLRCNHNDVNWTVQTFGTAKELRHLKAWSAI